MEFTLLFGGGDRHVKHDRQGNSSQEFYLHLTSGLRCRSRRRMIFGGAAFLTTLGSESDFFSRTPDAQLDHFLHHTPKFGVPVGMVQHLLKLLLNQRFLAVYHDFH